MIPSHIVLVPVPNSPTSQKCLSHCPHTDSYVIIFLSDSCFLPTATDVCQPLTSFFLPSFLSLPINLIFITTRCFGPEKRDFPALSQSTKPEGVEKSLHPRDF